MFISYKYRLYPTMKQKEALDRHFGCCRYVYNWGLTEKIKAYKDDNKPLSRFDLDKILTKKKKEIKWLSEVNSQSLQASLRHLEAAYENFFKHNRGFPSFKKKGEKDRFECPQNAIINFNEGKIKLPKIGNINIVISKIFKGNPRRVTISKTPTGKYFASVLINNEIDKKLPCSPDMSTAIGIDVGIKHFAILSTGEKIDNPRFLSKSLKRLKKLQSICSRRKKGSKNKGKSKLRIAKQYEKITNQRKDFLHKLSTKIVRENQSICVENLNIAGMVKNRSLSKAISDASWGYFIEMLEYKSGWEGKNLIKIGRFEPSSRMCTCGVVNKELKLSDREWTCLSCGSTHDRDLLAANNIKRFAFK